MIYLKQSTASQEVPLGYFLDSTNGNDEETALTIANTDIKVWKSGATTLASKNSGGATHISNGIYYTVLDATDTDTLGPLVLFVHVSGALAVRVPCVVLNANNYDSLIAGSDRLFVDALEISSDATAADNLELLVEGGPGYIRKGTAQAGAASTITLDASASAVNDFYNGNLIVIESGTGAGQARIVTDYDGSGKVATVGENWATNPASGSVFMILPGGNAVTNVNVTQISGDSAAADNLEAALDGTGYNVGEGDIVVSEVSGNVAGDVLGTLADLGTVIADSVPADGARPTVKQALYMLVQFMLERSVSGTTLTVRKPDGSTSLFTLTLDHATTPTSITRAT